MLPKWGESSRSRFVASIDRCGHLGPVTFDAGNLGKGTAVKKMMLGRRSARMVLVAVVGLGLAGGIAYATIPGAGNVYTACMLKNIGTISTFHGLVGRRLRRSGRARSGLTIATQTVPVVPSPRTQPSCARICPSMGVSQSCRWSTTMLARSFPKSSRYGSHLAATPGRARQCDGCSLRERG